MYFTGHDWFQPVKTGQATGLFMTGCWTLQPVAVASYAKFWLATGPAVASRTLWGSKVQSRLDLGTLR